MSLCTLSSFFSKIYMAAQIIEPKDSSFIDFQVVGEWIGWGLMWAWQGICLGLYGIVKWLLALVDFMQYFVQKLIGLDYWLNRSDYTFQGAIESDLIFGFLYSETIQKVFRAMMGLFFVLLIVFTIYAIIKSEWDHINGSGQGGKFGDGVGNSKTKIFKNSMKAIALVLIFPMILMIGIISANAILASLIKALNISTSSTLGGQIFHIASQDANKYEKYAHDSSGRSPVSDEVTFYINKDGKYVSLAPGDSSLVYQVNSIQEYDDQTDETYYGKWYTINSVFERVTIGGISGYNSDRPFKGYIAKLQREDEPFYIMASTKKLSDYKAMYYYLKCVLQVPIVGDDGDTAGFEQYADVKRSMSSDGYIKGLDLTEFANGAVTNAAWNTWNYASIYRQTQPFEDAESFVVTRNSGDGSLLHELKLQQITNAKIMYNSPLVSPYFDGGQFGVVQMQSEYLVMSEVIDFICENNFRLHMLDITSPLISWEGYNDYQVDNKWVALKTNKTPEWTTVTPYQNESAKSSIPFVISYSEACNETEMGNVLYFGKSGVGNELKGSKYIMCIKVDGAVDSSGNPINSKYIPLVNNKLYRDPITGKEYAFKSSYYSANYHGVVLAKGLLDSGASNAYRGDPTYLVSGVVDEDTKKIVNGEDRKDIPYYYDIKQEAAFSQYVESEETKINMNYRPIDWSKLYTDEYRYEINLLDQEEGSEKHIYELYKINRSTNQKTITIPTEDIIRDLKIKLYNEDALDEIDASYYGMSQDGNYLYSFLADDSIRYFFFVNVDSLGRLSILSSAGATYLTLPIKDTDSSYMHILAKTVAYEIYYDYANYIVKDATTGKDKITDGQPERASLFKQHLGTITPDNFSYDGAYGDGSLYYTKDMWSVESPVSKTMYPGIVFKTNKSNLITIKTNENGMPELHFARAYIPSNLDATEIGNDVRIRDKNIFSTADIRFEFYDFYTAAVGGESILQAKLYKYDPQKISDSDYNDDDIQEAVAPYPEMEGNYENWVFTGKVDNKSFDFDGELLHLYDGKTYVATIYRNKDSDHKIDEVNDLIICSTYVLYNDNYYYNIRTQNFYETKGLGKAYYQDIASSTVISCIRDNLSWRFASFDFAWVDIFSWRANLCFFMDVLDRNWQGKQFYITQGIQFDYFFEDTVVAGTRYGNTLITFYVPSEISFWIIIVASSLMIKVLGTSIWGVIKRIYEITLYFIAAPAVASTIALDGGNMFTSGIQKPLISKVLSTYGVMLGLNIFFILLYPVKSLSQIFTAADIATSNSYFMKNFFAIFGRQFQAKMLNLYVYLLFVLVAFTMIGSLPATISKMIGNNAEDVYASGKQVKDQAMKDLKSAGDFASGKTALDTGKDVIKSIKETPGAKLVGWGVGKVRELHDRAKQGVKEEDSEEGEKSSDSSSERSDEIDNENLNDESNNETGGEVSRSPEELLNQAVQDIGEGKYNSYEDLMQNGTDEEKQQAMEAKAQIEQATQGSPNLEEKAEEAFTENAENISEELGGEENEMIANAASDMLGKGGEDAKPVINIVVNMNNKEELNKKVFGDDEQGHKNKEDAVLATLSEEEKEKYDQKNSDEKQQFLDQFNVGFDENGSLQVQRGDGEAVSLQDSNVVGKLLQNSMSGAEISQNIQDAADQSENEELSNQAKDVQTAVGRHMAQNVASAANFDNVENDAIASQIVSNVLNDSEKEQNRNVINKAMLDYINADGNETMREMFQKMTGLSDEDMKSGKGLDEIDKLNRNGAISQLGITKDDYEQNVANVLGDEVKNGNYSISAWELYKQNAGKESVQEKIDNASEALLIRDEDEIELEKQRSMEVLKNREKQLIAEQVGIDVKGRSSEEIEQSIEEKKTEMLFEAAGVKSQEEFDKLGNEQKENAEAKVNKTMQDAEYFAKGSLLMNSNADSDNASAIENAFKAFAGLDSEEGIQKAIEESGVDQEELDQIRMEGYSDEEIAMSIKLASFGNYYDDHKSLKSKVNSFNLGKAKAAIRNSQDGDYNKAMQVYGAFFSDDETNEYYEEVADSGYRALRSNLVSNQEISQEVLYRVADLDENAVFEAAGVGSKEEYDKLSDEDKLNARKSVYDSLDNSAKSALWDKEDMYHMSLYEVDAILNQGKTRQEVYAELHNDSADMREISNIMTNGEVSTEDLMNAAVDEQTLSKKDKTYIEKMYSSRMQLVSEDDKKEARKQAEDDVIKALTEGATSRSDQYLSIAKHNFVDNEEAKQSFNTEFISQVNSFVRERADSKELAARKKEFMKNNKGATDEVFYEFLKVNMVGTTADQEAFNEKYGIQIKTDKGKFVSGGSNTQGTKNYAADLLGFENVSELQNANDEIQRSIVVGYAKEKEYLFNRYTDNRNQEILEEKNAELIKLGVDDKAIAVADRLENNKQVMQEADALYKSTHNGASLDEADTLERAAFLYTNFESSLSDRERRIIEKDHPLTGEQSSESIFEKISTDKEKFSSMYEFMSSDVGDSQGIKIASNLKRAVIKQEYDAKKAVGHTIDVFKDPEQMDEEDRKTFEFNKGILQQEMRANNDVVGNIFKHSTLLGEDGMVYDIAKAQGLNVEMNKKGEITLDGNRINSSDLKSKLDNDKVAEYMNSHETEKDKLLSLGAQDMTRALNDDSLQAKKVESVLNNTYLRNQVTKEALKGLSEEDVKSLIVEMLKKDGKEDLAENKQYINQNIGRLKTELALHNISIVRDENGEIQSGSVGEKNGNKFIESLNQIENTAERGMFRNVLHSEVTKGLKPSSYDPNTSSQEFFETRSIEEFTATKKPQIFNTEQAFEAFNKPNFNGYSEDVQIVTEDKTPPSFVNIDKSSLKPTNNNWHLFESAKNDKSIQTALKSQGQDVTYENVMAYLNKNEDIKNKQQKAVYAQALLAKVQGKDGSRYAQELKDKYQLIVGKGDTVESIMDKISKNRNAAKINKRASKLISDESNVELMSLVNNTDDVTKSQIKNALVSDEDLLQYAKDNSFEVDSESDNFKKHLIAAAQNDEYVKGRLGNKVGDANAVADFLNSNNKVKARISKTAQAAMIRDGSTGDSKFDKKVKNGQVIDEILTKKGYYSRGEVSDDELVTYAQSKGVKVDTESDKFKQDVILAAQNDEEVKQALGNDINDSDKVANYLKKHSKINERISNKIIATKLKNAETDNNEFNVNMQNGTIANELLVGKQGQFTNNAVNAYFGEMSDNYGHRSQVKRYKKSQKIYGKGVKDAEKVEKAEQREESMQQFVSYVKGIDLRSKSTKEANKQIAIEVNADEQKKLETKRGLLVNNSKVKKAMKEKVDVSDKDLADVAKTDFNVEEDIENIKQNNINLYNKIVSKAKDKKVEQEIENIQNGNEKDISQYDDILRISGHLDESGNLTNSAVANTQKKDIKRYKRTKKAESKELVKSKKQEKKDLIREAKEKSKSIANVQKGNYGEKTAENIEMFKHLDANEELKNEAKTAIESEGKTYSYDTVMEYLEKNNNTKKTIQKNVRIAEARKVFESELIGKTDQEVEEILQTDKKANAKVRKSLRSRKTTDISERVKTNDTLMREVGSSLVSDSEISNFITSSKVKVDVSDQDIVAEARKDAAFMGKVGKNTSDFDIRAYLEEHQKDKDKLTQKAKISKVKADANLMSQFDQTRGDIVATNQQIGRYFSGKKNNNNEHVRYHRTNKPIEKTGAYRFAAGLKYAGVGGIETLKFMGELTGVNGVIRGAKGKKGIKAVGAGALGFVSSVGFVGTASKLALMGKSNKWGQGGLSKSAIIGTQAIVFKTTKKLPQMCKQYENWNKVLNHKIQQIKQDTTLTRQQKLKQITIYESKKIWFNKPEYYDRMSATKKAEFNLEQDKLKREAYTDKTLANYVKIIDRVKQGKPPKQNIYGVMTQLINPIRERRQRHLHDHHHMVDMSQRLKATAAMRNKERDYGDNFEQVAKTFLDRKRYIDMMRRYKLKSAVEYQQMSASQKEQERRKREAALAAQIARLNRLFAKKVAKDSHVDSRSFLAARGVVAEVPRYKDGSKKYREDQHTLPAVGLGSVKSQLKNGAKSQLDITKIQNEAINIDKMMNEFITFSSKFKGTSAEYSAEFKKEFAKYGDYAQKIYDKHKGFMGIGSISKSPIAVQERKIMEGLKEELTQLRKRATSNGKISAPQSISSLFIGKTLTGATTNAEINLHKQHAEEIDRLLTLIKQQRTHVSYDSLTRRIGSTYMSDFYKKNPKIAKKSEEEKKNALESYFEDRLNQSLKQVYNDTKFKSDRPNLEKLNGRRVIKSEVNNSNYSQTLSNAMKTNDNPVYQSLVKEVNSSKEKVAAADRHLEELKSALDQVKSLPRNPKNMSNIFRLSKAMLEQQRTVTQLRTILEKAENKKADYEKAFAATQIRAAKASTTNLAYNKSHTSVLDNYEFTKVDGSSISKNSVDGKQVEMLVSKYIQNYRQSIESMIKRLAQSDKKDIKSYVDKMSKKFTDDFGRNMAFTREVRDELKKYIEALRSSTKSEDVKIRDMLETNVTLLTQSEQSLETSLKSMGVNIASIRLKTKK